MNEADADYLLAVRDAQDVPTPNRADLAMLIRDGNLLHLSGRHNPSTGTVITRPSCSCDCQNS